ncbi:MAG TPA: FAD-dependent oxidoreductase [Thermohalobaculum sp.]|nr:FAD-dependent oxidoreductase [Thermohalobaculum sp.]
MQATGTPHASRMDERITADLCVIGAGSGGLSVAAGAVQMGASVVLIERGRMGGDCLNYGCVPSKALIAAARAAQAHRASGALGVVGDEPAIDYAAVMDHVQRTIAAIAPHDSQERFEGLGVRVLRAQARFTGPAEVAAGGHTVAARRFVIATGSSPAVPPIPGLDAAPYLTNETIWENRVLPATLAVIGGGPIGVELAQAHRRLGSRVVLLEAATVLGREDPEIAAVALERLRAEGVEIREGVSIAQVSGAQVSGAQVSGEVGAVRIALADGEVLEATHLLVATGRRANVDDLGLDAAGVRHDAGGIAVDSGLRSVTNRRVYAVGDVAGGMQFTHLANYHAGLVVRSALFRLPVRARDGHIPRVTFTDPEIAQVGLTEAEARERHGDAVEVHRVSFADSDRALTEAAAEGLVKAVIGRRGRILGCSIVGARADELIHPWALALDAGLHIKALASYVAPYPTLGEASKRAAGGYYAARLFGNRWIRLAVRLLARLG